MWRSIVGPNPNSAPRGCIKNQLVMTNLFAIYNISRRAKKFVTINFANILDRDFLYSPTPLNNVPHIKAEFK